MRRLFMIPSILLIILFSAACASNKTPPTETAVPSVTASAAPTATSEPTSSPVSPTETPMTSTTADTSTSDVSTCPPEVLPIADWPFYCDDTYGFFVQYPSDTVTEVTDAGITRYNLSVLPNTNLGEKYLEITVQENPEICGSTLAAGYVPEAVGAEKLTINGLTFLKQSGTDAGAGNYYNWISYSTDRNGNCVSFDFVLHSTNRYNYPTPPPEFDFEAETVVIEQIIDTFRWVTP